MTQVRSGRAAWIADRTSCIIGKDTAARYKLQVGQKITLMGTFYPCDLELKIAGIPRGTSTFMIVCQREAPSV